MFGGTIYIHDPDNYLGYHTWISGADSVVRVEIWETSDSGEVLSRGRFGKTFGRSVEGIEAS
ncbi:hypothetical protein K435DRAFT_872333 [Dendrothele bispora CBS 962.96]|uniref:Uncharacterized protein n=1 Tax=Dendrothele bispora (strain CBS 962.96) TaxID=1314807 RepID=A0A4S8L2A6_DENBC|nr:hypothetical protein K435DRAFT_872333 [Dendrothele bispora CBS 962.96]